MTIINIKNDQLEIIIKTASPEEERQYLLQALCAAVRWNATTPDGDKYGSIDGQNLHKIVNIMESLIETKTIPE